MIFPERYELDSTSSAMFGGMGDVFVCKDKHLKRKVIIKLLKGEQEQRRFIDEQRALILLRSRHVVQLFDIISVKRDGNDENGLVMEHIDGDELVVGGYQFNEKFIHTLWQVASGLSDIHSAGIVHRDIKTNNILEGRDGVIKIIDFGLARHFSAAHTCSIIGTPVYMAPELWNQPNVAFDDKVDVYAFGILAVAMLGIKVPDGLFNYPPVDVGTGWLIKIVPTMSKEICELIEKCISHAKQNRPSMQNVELALRRHLLRDQHHGLFVLNGNESYIDARRRTVTLNYGTIGGIEIFYDGFDFTARSVSGIVTVNNISVTAGTILPAACVLTFGGPKGSRAFVTLDVSNPEVMV